MLSSHERDAGIERDESDCHWAEYLFLLREKETTLMQNLLAEYFRHRTF